MSDDTAATAVLSVLTVLAGGAAGWFSYKIAQLKSSGLDDVHPLSTRVDDSNGGGSAAYANVAMESKALHDEEPLMEEVEEKVNLIEVNFQDLQFQNKMSEDNDTILFKVCALRHCTRVISE